MYKSLLAYVIVFIIGLAGGYQAVIHKTVKSSTIKVEASPADASVLLDSKKARLGEIKVPAGSHQIIISKKGFASKTYVVQTSDGDEKYLGVTLSPNEKDTSNWYKTHPEDQKLAETISSHWFDYQSNKTLRDNPLFQQLPVILYGPNGQIRMDAGIPLQGSDQPAVYVTATTVSDRLSVLAWLKNNGYDASKIDLVFYDLSIDLGSSQ